MFNKQTRFFLLLMLAVFLFVSNFLLVFNSQISSYIWLAGILLLSIFIFLLRQNNDIFREKFDEFAEIIIEIVGVSFFKSIDFTKSYLEKRKGLVASYRKYGRRKNFNLLVEGWLYEFIYVFVRFPKTAWRVGFLLVLAYLIYFATPFRMNPLQLIDYLNFIWGPYVLLSVILGIIFLVASTPILISILTYNKFAPVYHWVVNNLIYSYGARGMSEREREIYLDTLGTIKESSNIKSKNIKCHRRVWVIDQGEIPMAYSLGHELLITRGAFNSPYLVALVAHQMGHLALGSSMVLLALKAATLPYKLAYFSTLSSIGVGTIIPPRKLSVTTTIDDFAMINSVDEAIDRLTLYGGAGIYIYSRNISINFREFDYLADWYTVRILGLEDELLNRLDWSVQVETPDPTLMRWRAYYETRIDYIGNPEKLYKTYPDAIYLQSNQAVV